MDIIVRIFSGNSSGQEKRGTGSQDRGGSLTATSFSVPACLTSPAPDCYPCLPEDPGSKAAAAVSARQASRYRPGGAPQFWVLIQDAVIEDETNGPLVREGLCQAAAAFLSSAAGTLPTCDYDMSSNRRSKSLTNENARSRESASIPKSGTTAKHSVHPGTGAGEYQRGERTPQRGGAGASEQRSCRSVG